MNCKRSFVKPLFASLLVTVFMLFTMPGLARASESVNYYRVQSGDSLWLIGWRFETTVEAITTANKLTTTQIMPDQILRIPLPTSFIREIPKTVTYSVKPGETLNLLAERFGVTAKAIVDLNKLSSASVNAGQTLSIPIPTQQRYTVKAGDSLYLVSQRFGVNAELLKLVNRMNNNLLWVGQVLFVPANAGQPDEEQPDAGQPDEEQPNPGDPPSVPAVPPVPQIPYGGQWGAIPSEVVLYLVQPGDNLWAISSRFKTTIAAIKITNHLNSELLNIGQPLFIPQNSSQPVTIPYPYAAQKDGFGELLDWKFTYWVLDTGSIATLTDLVSGKSFKARRLGGSNHSDMEPLTATDTAIMKQIYGGLWSWDRRAVLVEVDEKVIAGSMAGMPHDVQTITNNQFSGHFDLHFLNSRTHNTNSIDPKHQEMILKAAGQ